MKMYRCTVCDYIYDSTAGDPDNDIAPGTPFDELPPAWLCPLCQVDKSNFEAVE